MASRPEGYTSSESDSEDDSPRATPTDQSLTNIFTRPSFTDPMFAHMSRTLSTRELVQLKPVCKAIAPLISESSIFTAQARSQNDSMDCYFPLYFPAPDESKKATTSEEWERARTLEKRELAETWWVWSGVHHLTGETHTLPSLDYLPFSEMRVKFDRHGNGAFMGCLLPSSGSLLLFVLKAKNQKGDGAWNNTNLMSMDDHEVDEDGNPVHLEDGDRAHWMPLLVTNPLTRESRVLPEPANAKSTSWDYEGARAHLVEDEYANTYRILLVFRDGLYVYKSTTKCWNSWNFKKGIPWGFKSDFVSPDFLQSSSYYDVPCAISGGKVWYAELEVDGDVHAGEYEEMDTMVLTKGAVRVFEVNDEEGTWKPAIRYALKDYIPQDLYDAWTGGFGFLQGSYAIQMVECMGGVYILIPAWLNLLLTVGENIKQLYNLNNNVFGGRKRRRNVSYKDFGFLGIRFYILQLKGDGLHFGQALARLPHSTPHHDDNWYLMQLGWNPRWRVNPSPFYYARGWGSVISIVVDNYIIRYDVRSGVSTTEVHTNDSFTLNPDLSYRPSFYIKP